MSEHMSPIPSRIYNAAVGGHVCGPEDVDFGQKVVHLIKYDRGGNEVSFESQVTQANKIYVIHDDFILSSNVTIPSNCVLKFDGGSISGNGTGKDTISGANTGIDAGLVKIFNTNITLAGTWNVAEAYPEWFGAVKNTANDSRVAIQKCLDYFNKTILSGSYTISSSDNGVGITIPLGKILQGNAGSNVYMLLGDNLCKIVATSSSIKTIVEVRKGSQLKDFAIEGYLRTNEEWQVMPSNEEDTLKGISAKNADNVSRLLIDGIEVSFCNIGMDLQAYLSTCRNSVCSRCTGGFYVHGSTNSHYTSFKLERCYAVLNSKFGYKFVQMIYSSIDTCACDNCGIDENANKIATSDFTGAYDIIASYGISIISCGAENILSVLYCIGVSVISILDCRWQTHYDSNMTNWIFLKNNNNCIINISHEISNCPPDWKYVRIEGYDKTLPGYDIRGLSAERIDIISTGAGVSNTDIAKSVRIFGDAIRTYTISASQSIDSILRNAELFNQNTIEINANSDNIELIINGGEYYDSFGATTLVINGKENGNTNLRVYKVAAHNIFTNFKNIILNNIGIKFTDNRQIEGFIFKNTNIVLNNVFFRSPASNILFTSENTKIAFNNSFVAGNAKYDGEVYGKCSATNIDNTSYLVKNTAVTFSNGLVGYINDSVGKTIRFQFEVTSISDLTAKFADLTTNEKLLVVGSVGLVSNKPYWWNGTAWVDATGTPV